MPDPAQAPQKNMARAWGCLLVLITVAASVSWCVSQLPPRPRPVSATASAPAPKPAPPDVSTPSAPPTPDPDDTCRQDLRCWAEKQNIHAEVKCPRYIERMAKNDFEWTDGFFGMKFSHYRWKNKAAGSVTHIGDKIKYQNGFGAWIYHTYECDLDASGEQVLDVRVRPGRLQ